MNENSLKNVLKLLRKMYDEKKELDLLIANYVYENANLNKQKAIDYKSAMPIDTIFG